MKKTFRIEEISFTTDRRTAERLRSVFMRLLAKDKKSDGVGLLYSYKPLRKRACFTIGGGDKTVLKCVRAFGKFVRKKERADAKREEASMRGVPMARGSLYAMKPLRERKAGKRV